MRIKEKDLAILVKSINERLHTPVEAYSREGGSFVANIGNYHLDYAYGGLALYQMVSERGAVKDIFGGHFSKKDLYHRLLAFIEGLEAANDKPDPTPIGFRENSGVDQGK